MVIYSLQQISYATAQLPSSEEFEGGDEIIAIHRRTNTILIRRKQSFDVGQQCDGGIWKALHSWKLPKNHYEEFPTLVATIPIESLDAFLLIFSGPKASYAVFLSLEGEVLNDIQITQKVLCADIDQNRKELLMGLPGGRVVSYAIRFQMKKIPTGKVATPSYQYLLILRKYIILSSLEKDKSASLLAIGDIAGVCLCLMNGGGIIALETSNLEVLWHIPASRFVYPPVTLWLDKYGLDFLVWCRDADNSNENSRRETLEYWTVPMSMAECDANQFGRVSIPVPGQLLSATIESINLGPSGQEVLIAVFTRNNRLQLWQAHGGAGVIRLHCDMPLHRSMDEIRCSSSAFLFRDSNYSYHLPSSFTRLNATSRMQFMSPPPDVRHAADLSILLTVCCDLGVVSIHKSSAMDMDIEHMLKSVSILKYRHHSQIPPRGRKFDISRLPRESQKEAAPEPIEYRRPDSPAGTSVFDLSMGEHPAADESGRNEATMPPLNIDIAKKPPILDDSLEQPDSARSMASSTSSFSVDITVKSPSSQGRSLQKTLSARFDVPMISSATKKDSPTREKEREFLLSNVEHVAHEQAVRDTMEAAAPMNDTLDIMLPSEEFHPPHSPINDHTEPIVLEDPKLVYFFPIQIIEGLNLPPALLQCISQFGSRQDVSSMYGSDCFLTLASPPSSIIISLPDNDCVQSSKGAASSKSTSEMVVSTRRRQMKEADTSVTSSHLKLRSQLKLLTSTGLKEVNSMDDIFHSHDLAKHLIDCRLFSLGYIIGVLGIVTSMNECFLTCLAPRTDPSMALASMQPKPLRLPVDIRQQATPTVLLISDVCMILPNAPAAESKKTASSSSSSASSNTIIDGVHSLSLIGDSDGLVHITISTRNHVISSSQIKAHSSPVVSIFTTGDSLRPLWRVGGKLQPIVSAAPAVSTHAPPAAEQHKHHHHHHTHGRRHSHDKNPAAATSSKLKTNTAPMQVHPVAIPGSAIITVSRDGEVKIWQPHFVFDGHSQSKTEHVLSVCKVQWQVAGMYSCAQPVGRPLESVNTLFCTQAGNVKSSNSTMLNSNRVVCATLDPTCMTLLVSFGSGRVEQWPLPGLICSPKASLSTCRQSMWSLQAHKGSITDMRLWVHMPSTVVSEANIGDMPSGDGSTERGKKQIRYASVVHSASVLNTTIAYTTAQMRTISEASTMVTSSADKSILLWRFVLTEQPIDGLPDENDMNSYMQLYPCKRFLFSDTPRAGICFSTSKFDLSPSYVWRVTAIVAGVLVTPLEGPHGELLKRNESISAEYIVESSAGPSMAAGGQYHRIPSPAQEATRAIVAPDGGQTDTVLPLLQDTLVLPSSGHVLKPLKTMDSVHRVQQMSKTVPAGDMIWSVYELWANKTRAQQLLHDGPQTQNKGEIDNSDIFVDEAMMRLQAARADSPTTADLHFAPSSRPYTKGHHRPPPRTVLLTNVTEVTITTTIASGGLGDESLHGHTQESPHATPRISPRRHDSTNASAQSAHTGGNREKVVVNGVHMEVPIGDDDATIHSAVSSARGTSKRYTAADTHQTAATTADVNNMLLSRADAMWERLTKRLDSSGSPDKQKPDRTAIDNDDDVSGDMAEAASPSSHGGALGFNNLPTVAVEKKKIVANISVVGGHSPTTADKKKREKLRDLSPMRDSPFNDSLIDMPSDVVGGHFSSSVIISADGAVKSSDVTPTKPADANSDSLKKAYSMNQMEALIIEGASEQT
jgi:hypothetical protein